MDPIASATQALRDGKIVLLYDADGREEETDMVVASQHADADTVRTLRREAGGLVCTAIGPEVHDWLGLPWLTDLLRDASPQAHAVLAGLSDAGDIPYDGNKPAFGLTINHRDTFTGITDADRALTIQALAEFVTTHKGDRPAAARAAFGRRFRTPGHVQLLNGAAGGLADRQGHTELSLELARLAALPACTTICEMLDPASGRALSKRDAQSYARAHGMVFLTGGDVLGAWREKATPVLAPMSV